MAYPLKDVCVEELEGRSFGIRSASIVKGEHPFFVGNLLYQEGRGVPAGYYLVLGDGITTKRYGPLKASDILEDVEKIDPALISCSE